MFLTDKNIMYNYNYTQIIYNNVHIYKIVKQIFWG